MEKSVFKKTIKYKLYIQMGILASLFIVLYYPILPALYRDWIASGIEFRSDNSHGILVPFISFYLIWKCKDELSLVKIKSSNLGLILIIPSLMLYLIGYAGGVFIIPRIMMIASFIGLVIYAFGARIFKTIAFPLLFLFFMVPIPYSILKLVSLPLQTLVTIISGFLLRDVFSLSVFREGNMLYFPNTSLEVAEACSGIRSLITFLMLGFLFAYISGGTKKSKSVFLIMAVPLALFTNLLRVTGTGILANFFGSGVAKGFLHEFSGFVVLAIGLVMMVGIWKIIQLVEGKTSGRNSEVTLKKV